MITDLENVVLGVVFLEQPCTAYAVRKVFARSLSAHWSASAGSIYPAIRRLTVQKLLNATLRPEDGRGARTYRLTPKGRRQLANWLKPPLPEGAALMCVDPLRIRFRFLDALAPEEARASIAEASRNLNGQADRIRQALSSGPNAEGLAALIHRGALLGIEAQLAWLNELSRFVSNQTA